MRDPELVEEHLPPKKLTPWRIRLLDERDEAASDLALAKARVRKKNGSPAMEAAAIENALADTARVRARDRRRLKKHVDVTEADASRKFTRKELPTTRHELLQELHGAFSRMTPTQRVVMTTVVMQELTYAQAARALGMSEATIKAHLRDARSRL